MTEMEKTELQAQLNETAAIEETYNFDDIIAGATPPEPDTSDEREPERGEAQPVKVSAQMYVQPLDLIVSRGCAMYADEKADKFKLSEDEKNSLKEAAEAYFATSPVFISPAGWFALATILAVSVPAFLAYQTRKEKDEAAAKLEAAKKKAEAENREKKKERRPEQQQTVNVFEKQTAKRKRFEVDSNDFFCYAENGQYLKAEDRDEKANGVVLKLIKEKKSNKDILAVLAKMG